VVHYVACRAGSRTEYCFGDDEVRLTAYAWSGLLGKGGARTVATKRANAWGLFDLHGNVREWCEDSWHGSYEGAPDDGSARQDAGSPERVLRGGSWVYPARACRSSFRSWSVPICRFYDIGFRPAFVLPDR
jgi:formylglycine-generating enzyme required for sulfatase activity